MDARDATLDAGIAVLEGRVLRERAAELEPAIEEAIATLGRLGAVTLLRHLAPSSAQADTGGVTSAAG